MFINKHKDLELEIIKGIDGTALFPAVEFIWQFPKEFFIENNLDYKRCAGWNKGQLGCAMSNLLVQKEILHRKLSNALILEDDALLIDSNLEYFVDSIKELPKSWELFYLGYRDSKYFANRITRALLRIHYKLSPVVIQNKASNVKGKYFLAENFSKHLYKPGIYMGTHAYALSYNGAKKIVDLDSPLQYGFDTTLMHACYHNLVEGYALKEKLFQSNPKFETSLING